VGVVLNIWLERCWSAREHSISAIQNTQWIW